MTIAPRELPGATTPTGSRITSPVGAASPFIMTNPDPQDLLPPEPRRIGCRLTSMERVQGKPATWPRLRLGTTGKLARWLRLTPRQLEWFADCRHWNEDGDDRLRHYTLHWLRKPSGNHRLLEVPKPRLKQIQRRLLDELLAHLPPHRAAHAYRKGRSLLGFAAPHLGKRLVLRLDLHDFFPSIPAARVHALFRRLGYPLPVARLLTGLCTHTVPPSAWPTADTMFRQRFAVPHLPQGAPTSPALANLCSWRLDARLSALAQAAGAVYTRYADDLAFSGGRVFERAVRRFQVQVMCVALEEGFDLNPRKSRFMRAGLRQQLCGVVVSFRPNVCRPEFDRLKAILHNCVRHGPASQNRTGQAAFRGHLLGRVQWLSQVNPHRGAKLRAIFQRIRWDPEQPASTR